MPSTTDYIVKDIALADFGRAFYVATGVAVIGAVVASRLGEQRPAPTPVTVDATTTR